MRGPARIARRAAVVGALILAAVLPTIEVGAVFRPCRNPTIRGTERSDFLVGTARSDVIKGFGGSDVILGLGGVDTICGNRGHDVLDGGDGTGDFLYGGRGTDRCSARDYWQGCDRGGA